MVSDTQRLFAESVRVGEGQITNLCVDDFNRFLDARDLVCR
jgi:hypothetical protein